MIHYSKCKNVSAGTNVFITKKTPEGFIIHNDGNGIAIKWFDVEYVRYYSFNDLKNWTIFIKLKDILLKIGKLI